MARILEELLTDEGAARLFARDDGTYMVAGPGYNSEFDAEEEARAAFEEHFEGREERPEPEHEMSMERLSGSVARLDPTISEEVDLSDVLVTWTLPDGTPMHLNGMPIFHVQYLADRPRGRVVMTGAHGNQGVADALASIYGATFTNRFGTEYRAAWTMATWSPEHGEWSEYISCINRLGLNAYFKSTDIGEDEEWRRARKDFSPLKDSLVGDVEKGHLLDGVWRQSWAADFSNVIENGIPLTEMPDTLPELGEREDPAEPTDEQREAEEIAKSSEIQRLEKRIKSLQDRLSRIRTLTGE